MIDDKDLSESTLRFILWEALGAYSTPALLKLLEDEDYIVRTASAKQLQRRPDNNVFQTAVNMLSDSTVYKREIGAYLLGQLGAPSMPYMSNSVPALLRLFDDADPEVRSAAVAAIGHLGSGRFIDDEEILNRVLKLAEDLSSDVRACAAFTLGSFAKSDKVINELKKLNSDKDAEVASWAKNSIEILTERKS